MKLPYRFTLTTCTLLLIASPSLAQQNRSPASGFNIAAVTAVRLQPMGTLIVNDKRLSHFRDLVRDAKLEGLLNANGAFTVFAPNNEARASLPEATQNRLKEDTQYRKKFIMSHVFPGKMTTDFLKTTDAIRALSTHNVLLVNDNNTLRINNVPLLTTDINASNGVIHIVSNPLLLK